MPLGRSEVRRWPLMAEWPGWQPRAFRCRRPVFYTPRKARFPPLLGLSARLARSWKPIDGFRVSKFFTLGERYR